MSELTLTFASFLSSEFEKAFSIIIKEYSFENTKKIKIMEYLLTSNKNSISLLFGIALLIASESSCVCAQ